MTLPPERLVKAALREYWAGPCGGLSPIGSAGRQPCGRGDCHVYCFSSGSNITICRVPYLREHRLPGRCAATVSMILHNLHHLRAGRKGGQLLWHRHSRICRASVAKVNERRRREQVRLIEAEAKRRQEEKDEPSITRTCHRRLRLLSFTCCLHRPSY